MDDFVQDLGALLYPYSLLYPYVHSLHVQGVVHYTRPPDCKTARSAGLESITDYMPCIMEHNGGLS